jgi:hypothetical protein
MYLRIAGITILGVIIVLYHVLGDCLKRFSHFIALIIVVISEVAVRAVIG